MQTNSDQDTQETGETRGTSGTSLFSRITLDLKTIIIGVTITAVGTIVANYLFQEYLKRYVSYENSDYGIELEHPRNWSIQENLLSLQPEVKFLSPQENNPDDFQEKVTVSIENLAQPLSLNEYTEKATAQIEASNTIVEKPKKTTFANKEGRKIVYQEKDGNKKRLEVWMIKNQKAYIATYTAEEEKFDKFAKQADKIIESLVINN